MSYDDLPYFRDQILERIDSLKCFLSNTPPMMANLMTVSTVSRTEERLKQVKPIRVSIKDDASVEEIIQALTDICVDDIESLSHDSTKVTTKYPGLIIVPERADLLESLITSINEAKNDFAAAMRRIDNKKNVRFDKVHKKLPGLVAMHSTRNILFIKSQLKKVTFSWRLNRNQEVKTAEQLVSLLERRRASEVKNVATTNLNVVSNIDKALHRLEFHPLKQGESYRLCRTNSFPVPIAHIFAFRPEGQERNGNKYAETDYSVVKASLPIFAAGNIPQLKTLSDWAPESSQGPSNQRKLSLKYTELVPGAELGIFIVSPEN